MPKSSASFASLPAVFGGPQDQLVLRAGTCSSFHVHIFQSFQRLIFILASDIHIWGRDTAVFLREIKVPENPGHLTTFAWNRGLKDTWMFAVGTHDGIVHIWSVSPDKRPHEGKGSLESALLPAPGSSIVLRATLSSEPATLDTGSYSSQRLTASFTRALSADSVSGTQSVRE